VNDAEFDQVSIEGLAGELGAAVGEHPGELDGYLGETLYDVVDEVRRRLGGLVAHEEPADGAAGGGVDGGELLHGAHALELAHVEGVQSHQVPWPGGEVAEREGPLLGRLGEQAGVHGGDWARAAIRWLRQPRQ